MLVQLQKAISDVDLPLYCIDCPGCMCQLTPFRCTNAIHLYKANQLLHRQYKGSDSTSAHAHPSERHLCLWLRLSTHLQLPRLLHVRYSVEAP